MDRYQEEQSSEIEALSSIYIDEIEILNDDPHCFVIPVQTSESYDDNEEINVDVSIQYTFTNCYPDEIPSMEVANGNGLTQQDEMELLDALKAEASNNIGMVMIFTLVSVTQEFLSSIIEKIKTAKDEKKRLADIELQKEEEKKYHGTPVTVESFTKWKIAFDNEIMEKLGRKVPGPNEVKKLTGRQLFETDATLQFSDAQFYSEATGGVQVDESLFQDLEDLDIVDED